MILGLMDCDYATLVDIVEVFYGFLFFLTKERGMSIVGMPLYSKQSFFRY